MNHPSQEHEKQPSSWLDAEPDERQFMDEADAEGWELVSLRAVGVTEFLDLDDEPAVRDTPAGTEPDSGSGLVVPMPRPARGFFLPLAMPAPCGGNAAARPG
ncbi:hypothetical protein Xvtf_08725 [Xanthomonas campestris pv. vitistrifoliae]|nr:hypothetical protein Xvtf_08725 [Xanthomonas campestris pv. vitistrifoliae]